MRLKTTLILTAALLATSGAQAGDFVQLKLDGSLTVGSNNPNSDALYIVNKSTPGSYSSISYDAIATSGSIPRTVTGSGTLTLLDQRVTTNISLAGQSIGNLYDYVFRDSRDNRLVFGTRVELGVLPGQATNAEINFMYRAGFQQGSTTFGAAAAWLFATDSDLRMYTAGRTSSNTFSGALTYDPNVVRFQSDINLSEGNPLSGLYLLKTDAASYQTLAGAVQVFQAGEEGQPRVGSSYQGFAPAIAAVPEPQTVALLLAGLGAVATVARRRNRRA